MDSPTETSAFPGGAMILVTLEGNGVSAPDYGEPCHRALKSGPSIAKVLTRLPAMLASEAASLTPVDTLKERSGKAACPGTCPGV